MAGLVETYWETLYPLPDEDGIATRVAPITGLNGEGGDGTLIQPLRKLLLFERPDGTPVYFWQYEQSAEVSAIGDAARRQQRLDAGVAPFEEIETAARAAVPRFRVIRNSARRAAEGWAALSTVLEAKAGRDAPPTSRVRDLLARIHEVAARYVGEEPEAPAELQEAPPAAVPAIGGAAPQAVPGRLESREDALRLLGEVAEFFRRTEPHSPLAYTLNEAARRARLSWPELLAEVVPDLGTRAAIFTTLGIRPPEE
jgi:type VI secretion system protein ImpA